MGALSIGSVLEKILKEEEKYYMSVLTAEDEAAIEKYFGKGYENLSKTEINKIFLTKANSGFPTPPAVIKFLNKFWS